MKKLNVTDSLHRNSNNIIFHKSTATLHSKTSSAHEALSMGCCSKLHWLGVLESPLTRFDAQESGTSKSTSHEDGITGEYSYLQNIE